MSVKGFDHENILIYPVAIKNFTTLDKTLVPVFGVLRFKTFFLPKMIGRRVVLTLKSQF